MMPFSLAIISNLFIFISFLFLVSRRTAYSPEPAGWCGSALPQKMQKAIMKESHENTSTKTYLIMYQYFNDRFSE
jgi:hypothetical protein